MNVRLIPIDDTNRDAVIALSVRDDQPFVAPNDYSLKQADEANAENPGVARPFAIYADDRLVGFCMFAFAEEEEEPEDRYWLWRFMIDKKEQGKGYGQAALAEIVRYFRENGADRLYLSTEPENEVGIYVYRKAGFRYTGFMDDDEAVYMQLFDHEFTKADENDEEIIDQNVNDWCYSVIPAEKDNHDGERLVFAVKEGRHILGGCIVNIHEWGRAVLACLWVHEKYRGHGLGSALIKRAEQAAKEKGCYYLCLGTVDFQAKSFYEKHGYTVFTTTKDYPRGHESYSLSKRLDAECPGYVPQNNDAAERFVIETGTDEDAGILADGLDEYCDRFIPDARHFYIGLSKKLVDKDGNMIAGIVAGVDEWYGASVDSIWVDEEYRGVDIGSVLLGEFERDAMEEGAYIVLTYATDLNVDFFKEHDYVVRGTLKDYPKGHTAYELEKRL